MCLQMCVCLRVCRCACVRVIKISLMPPRMRIGEPIHCENICKSRDPLRDVYGTHPKLQMCRGVSECVCWCTHNVFLFRCSPSCILMRKVCRYFVHVGNDIEVCMCHLYHACISLTPFLSHRASLDMRDTFGV